MTAIRNFGLVLIVFFTLGTKPVFAGEGVTLAFKSGLIVYLDDGYH